MVFMVIALLCVLLCILSIPGAREIIAEVVRAIIYIPINLIKVMLHMCGIKPDKVLGAKMKKHGVWKASKPDPVEYKGPILWSNDKTGGPKEGKFMSSRGEVVNDGMKPGGNWSGAPTDAEKFGGEKTAVERMRLVAPMMWVRKLMKVLISIRPILVILTVDFVMQFGAYSIWEIYLIAVEFLRFVLLTRNRFPAELTAFHSKNPFVNVVMMLDGPRTITVEVDSYDDKGQPQRKDITVNIPAGTSKEEMSPSSWGKIIMGTSSQGQDAGRAVTLMVGLVSSVGSYFILVTVVFLQLSVLWWTNPLAKPIIILIVGAVHRLDASLKHHTVKNEGTLMKVMNWLHVIAFVNLIPLFESEESRAEQLPMVEVDFWLGGTNTYGWRT